MGPMVVKTSFSALDLGIGKQLKKLTAGVRRFGTDSSKSFRKASRGASTFKSVLGGVLGAGFISRGLGLLTQGIRSVTTEFISFDDSLTAAAAKFGGIERGDKVFKALQKTARAVGATTEFTGTQASEGLRFLAKAGWSAVDAMKALPSFVDLATASEMEFSRAADIATDVLGAFQLPVETTEQRLKSLTRVNDVLSKSVNMSNIDMEDLFETIKDAGPIAATAGISIEKFSAIASFIGGAGIKGSKGGTALKNAIVNLAQQTPKAKKLFKRLKIDLADTKGNLRDPIKLFQELGVAMKGMGNKQKLANLALLFGKRSLAGVAVSVADGTKKLNKFEDALLAAGGTSKKMAEFMRQSIGKRLKELQSAAIETGFQFLDAFEKKIPGGIDAAIDAVRRFDMGPFIETVREVTSFIKNYWEEIKIFTGVIVGAIALQKIFNFVVGANPYAMAALGLFGMYIAIKKIKENWSFLKQEFGPWFDKYGKSLAQIGKGFAGGGGVQILAGVAGILRASMSGADLAPAGRRAVEGQIRQGTLNLATERELYTGYGQSHMRAPNEAEVREKNRGNFMKGKITFANAPDGLQSEFKVNETSIDQDGLGPNK